MSASTDGNGVWITCSGVFQAGPATQLQQSGVVYLDALTQPATIAWRLAAADVGDRPFGFEVVGANATSAFAIIFGKPGVTPDRVVAIDPAQNTVHETGVVSDSFGFGDLFTRSVRGNRNFLGSWSIVSDLAPP